MLDDAGSLSVGFRERREGKETGEEEGKQNEESDERMISNFWRKKEKNVCSSLFCFPGRSPSVGSFMGDEGEVRWKGHHGGIRGRSKVIVVFVCVCVRARVSRLSAAVRRRLPLSVHGGRLVLHAVQVLLLGDGQHRRQDLIVLPVRQT